MRDETKDRVEDSAAATLEALVSLVPGIGGVLSVFTNRVLGSSFERRTVRILTELRDDLSRLEQSGLAHFDERLAEDDSFQASVHRTIRQLLEAASDDKRTLLRHALLNRIVGFEEPERFDDALERVLPGDMVVLASLQTERRYGLTDVVRYLDGGGEEHGDRHRVHRLVRLGLVDDVTKSGTDLIAEHLRAAERGHRTPSRRPRSEHVMSDFGREFVDYVTDPVTRMTSSPRTEAPDG
ncbi:hypothetical protein [Curtobacterium sp. 458]|uniref:hypothetical protein n=1 Tax=Curtobacterium sp. 458 TaxID=3050069 RepID=UPI0025B48DBA|nr:hypothetical protein [Curtobacterium sp. 458]WJY00836.1 hypothetical protein QPJ90_03845 [Curtobacterium sp. 458]